MKAIELMKHLLEAEIVPSGKKYLLLLDIDDTLLTANNIFIIKIYPDGRKEKLTPDQYSKRDREGDKTSGVSYSYEEFRDSKKIVNSIMSGTPILRNLKLMDNHINSGWKIGILTARALEDTVHDAIKKWLKYRDSDGELKSIGNKLTRELVHAINNNGNPNEPQEGNNVYAGTNDFEKKANVIRKYAKVYDKVKFLDDDAKNLSAVREMAKNEGLKNVVAVKAWAKE